MKLPDLTLETLQHEPLRLRPEAPAPRLILVYRRDCETCELVLPVVERISRPLHARGLETIGVSQSDEDATLDAINEHGLCFPQALDADLALSLALGVEIVPTLLLFDADGARVEGTDALDLAAFTRVVQAAARLAGADEPAIARAIAAFALPASRPGSASRTRAADIASH